MSLFGKTRYLFCSSFQNAVTSVRIPCITNVISFICRSIKRSALPLRTCVLINIISMPYANLIFKYHPVLYNRNNSTIYDISISIINLFFKTINHYWYRYLSNVFLFQQNLSVELCHTIILYNCLFVKNIPS